MPSHTRRRFDRIQCVDVHHRAGILILHMFDANPLQSFLAVIQVHRSMSKWIWPLHILVVARDQHAKAVGTNVLLEILLATFPRTRIRPCALRAANSLVIAQSLVRLASSPLDHSTTALVGAWRHIVLARRAVTMDLRQAKHLRAILRRIGAVWQIASYEAKLTRRLVIAPAPYESSCAAS